MFLPVVPRGTAMSVPSTLDDLLGLIRTSGMVDESQLTTYVERCASAGRALPTDAKSAADRMVDDSLISDFQREQFLLGKWRGFTVGKYKLLERVGIGGMGQVFLCEHLHMKRHVAIKVLPPAKAEQPSALGRFYREARAAGSIEHPNIVRTFDIDQDGNLHYIVMEYVDGSNLLDIVKQVGPLPIGRAVDYACQIANGLDFAFRNGIIHRDVKPGNVLITRHGEAKILDMGLARFYKDTTDLLTVQYDDKIVLGTADYVAPEQVANSHGVDTRADVYGLGATLYYLLSGKPPFPTGTVSQKLLWHRTKDPTPIRDIRPDVPEGVAAALARMMKKDPSLRFQSAGEVAAELAQWIPADVPLPDAREMPRLSPIAKAVTASENEVTLSAETPAPVSDQSGTSVGQDSGNLSGQFNPFAGARSGVRLTGSASGVTRRGPFSATRGPFAPPAPSEVPTATTPAHDPTPADVPVPGSSPFQHPASAPGRNPLLVPLIGAMVAVGLAILVLVYMLVLK